MTRVRISLAAGQWRGRTRHWDVPNAPQHSFEAAAENLPELQKAVDEHAQSENFQAFLRRAIDYAPGDGTLIVYFTAIDDPFADWGWLLEPYAREIGQRTLYSFLRTNGLQSA